MSRRNTWREAARRRPARYRSSHSLTSLGRSLDGRSKYACRLRLEALEDRRLLAGITVTTLADTIDFNDGVTSLREAIFAANTVQGPDTIEFAPAITANGPATILLTQGELKITDSLTIDGPGSELLTIDASGSDPTPDVKDRAGSRIFNTVPPTRPASGERLPSLQIEGLTLTGGDAQSRGGAILSAGMLTLTDCRVIGNSSYSGGGVSLGMIGYESNHILGSKFVDCWFEGNVAAGYGGGVWVYDNTVVESSGLEITNCTFVGNSAGADGGGLYVEGYLATIGINSSAIHGNTARRGGGVFAGTLIELRIANSAVHENVSSEDGGGIYSNGPLYVGQSSIYGNTARRLGGGIRALDGATIESSTISGNMVHVAGSWFIFGGGGVYCSGPLFVRNSTVTGNTAGTAGLGGNYGIGGGILAFQAVIDHSIVANNTRGQLAKPDDLAGSARLSYSLLGVNAGVAITEVGRNLIGTLESRIDPLLGPLVDNGGFELPDGSRILTHALLPGSPAINAGDLNAGAGAAGVPTFDQRGEPFGRIVGERIDIGAFEYQTPTDLNLLVDTLVDESDGDYSRGDLSLREAIELSNAADYDGVVDTIRFDPALWADGPATILLTMGEIQITDSLTIDGPGAELLKIDASGNDPTPDVDNADGSRIFYFTAQVAVRGLTLTGGDLAEPGGAIFNGGVLDLYGVHIINNSSDTRGGGIASLNGFLSLERSIVAGNSAGDGGGIYAANSVLTIQQSTVEQNTARVGGGLYTIGVRSVEIVDSLFEENSATEGNGGGIFQWLRAVSPLGQNMVVRGSTFRKNSALDGGGIYSRPISELLNIDDTHFEFNTASRDGGGVYSGPIAFSGGSLVGNVAGQDGGGMVVFPRTSTFTETEFSGNSAGRNGGGLAVIEVNPDLFAYSPITSSTFTGNSAGAAGGGIYGNNLLIDRSTIDGNTATDGGGLHGTEVIVERSTLSNNSAETGGGAWLWFARVDQSTISSNLAVVGGGVYGVTIMDRSTLTLNRASSLDGGIFNAGGAMRLDHSIVAQNIGTYPDATGLVGASFDARFSLIGDYRGSGLSPTSIGRPDGNGNLVGGFTPALVIDAKLGPLADNGGSTMTHAPLAGSPAIKAGDPAAVPGVAGVPLHDQRGVPFIRNYGGRIDIGAFELQPTDVLAGDYNGDGVVDAADYTVWRDRIGIEVAAPGLAPDGNGDRIVDDLDFAVWKANFGATDDSLPAAGGVGLDAALVVAVQGEPPAKPGAGGRVPGVSNFEVVAPQPPALPGVTGGCASQRAAVNWSTPRDKALAAWVATQSRHHVRATLAELSARGDDTITVIDWAFDELRTLGS